MYKYFRLKHFPSTYLLYFYVSARSVALQFPLNEQYE